MKRGFLNSAKAKNSLSSTGPSVENNGQRRPTEVKLPVGKVEKPPQPDGIKANSVQAQEGPSKKPDYDDQQPVFSTIPVQKSGDEDSDPFGRTECMMYGAAKRKIYSTPGFGTVAPAKPPQVSYRIGPSSIDGNDKCGLGMFATRNIKLGDLILSERPLLLLPAIVIDNIPPGYTLEQIIQMRLIETEKALHVPLDRMIKKRREAYMKLTNSHTEDGSGPIYGIARTNGFEIPELKEEAMKYTAVCDEISRINHSCRPNVTQHFDMPSFSFRVLATRDIRSGEELFIAYGDILKPFSERQKFLAPYGFSCTCSSCIKGPNSDADAFRASIPKRVPFLLATYSSGRSSKATLRNMAHALLKEVEDEGLEGKINYFWVLSFLAKICEKEEGKKYKDLARRWEQAHPALNIKDDPFKKLIEEVKPSKNY